MEVWKGIIIEKNGVVYDYTGLYQVSNLGRVRSLNYNHTGKIKELKLRPKKDGYIQVVLYKDGKSKQFYVHRLVATTFMPNDDPINKTEVNHISEVKTDCSVDNLEWVTPKQNINHGTGKKRASKAKSKKVICIETGQIFDSIKEAQAWLNKGDVCACVKGRTKTAGGYHWQYVD